MYKALYRLWRPKSFDEVCGQDQVTDVLRSEVMGGRISHAYLFCGSRGTGKTTCAKILAKAVNCENPVNGSPCGKCRSCLSIENGTATDVVEMDAASNNGVENIRALRDEVVYTPSDLKYRVYIVDEVHMLSQSAFNALLKTLEEPPEYVVFILATTERHKIPATILSRCQRFDFNRVTVKTIVSRLRTVCEGEGILADDDSLALIGTQANGSFRDALNLLEYCAASSRASGEEIRGEYTRLLLGSAPLSLLRDVAVNIAKKDIASVLVTLDEVDRKRDVSVFLRELTGFYRNMLVVSSAGIAPGECGISEEEYACAKETAALYNKEEILSALDALGDAVSNTVLQPRLAAEMTFVRLCMESGRTSDGGEYSAPTSGSVRVPEALRGADAKKTESAEKAEKAAPVPPVTDEYGDPPPETAPAYVSEPARESRTVEKRQMPPKNDDADALWDAARKKLTGGVAPMLEGTFMKKNGNTYTIYTDRPGWTQILSAVYRSQIAGAIGIGEQQLAFSYYAGGEERHPIDEIIQNNREELK